MATARFPDPVSTKQALIIPPPPLCLTDGIRYLSWCVVFGFLTVALHIWAKYLHFGLICHCSRGLVVCTTCNSSKQAKLQYFSLLSNGTDMNFNISHANWVSDVELGFFCNFSAKCTLWLCSEFAGWSIPGEILVNTPDHQTAKLNQVHMINSTWLLLAILCHQIANSFFLNRGKLWVQWLSSS